MVKLLVVDDEVDVGLLMNLRGLEEAGNTTIAEDDVLGILILLGL